MNTADHYRGVWPVMLTVACRVCGTENYYATVGQSAVRQAVRLGEILKSRFFGKSIEVE